MSKSKQPGAHSLAEILSQPACWSACFQQLEQSKQLQAVEKRFDEASALYAEFGPFYTGMVTPVTYLPASEQR